MRKMLFALVVVAAGAGAARAGWPVANPNYNPQTGTYSAAGTKSFLTGQPLPPPKFSPIVGSVQPAGHGWHLFGGKSKYKGSALDPNTGRVFQYKFRQ
jgi:hypothetical protein